MKIISYPFAVILPLLLPGSSALPQYARKIPNGYSVPNPNVPGSVWAGVGHVNAAGGGDRNPFGEDFAANGHLWTAALCQMDSDGDGRSNGQELGDPDCIWMEGDDPAGPAVSHPGIPEEEAAGPIGSPCDDYVKPMDEISMDVGFSSPAQMDATQTHYICEQKVIDVPAQTKLHIIKTGVLLDNPDVLHHMFVYVCPSAAASTDGDRLGEGHYECSGNESGCRTLGSWAVGPHERCQPPNIGFELDFTEATRLVVKVEAHYDNTSGQPQQDQSGIRIYMTPTLRPLVGSAVVTGMDRGNHDFVIPAREPHYILSGICPSAITDQLSEPIYVFGFNPHMHLYGKSIVTEHYRCGEKIGEIGRLDAYEFDNQQRYTLDPPVKILPGDTFVTKCGFDTSGVDFDVVGGEETTDEMCLQYLLYYSTNSGRKPTTIAPGSRETQKVLSACMSFENGLIKRNGEEIFNRFVMGGTGFFTGRFESDPTANFGSCCAANNCEELWMAVEGEACGVDGDCMGDLICDGGLCFDDAQTSEYDTIVSEAATEFVASEADETTADVDEGSEATTAQTTEAEPPVEDTAQPSEAKPPVEDSGLEADLEYLEDSSSVLPNTGFTIGMALSLALFYFN